MNDDLTLTEQQLRLATSRALAEVGKLDPEAAAMRENFVALGSALESAAGQFDEVALVERLTESCLKIHGSSDLRSKPRLAGRELWTIVLSGALAAAALVTMARIAMESRQNVAAVAVPSIQLPLRGPQEHLALAPLAEGWNDPLDDEIALAAETIGQLASRNRGFDDSLMEMHQRLEALSLELGGESL